MTQAGHFDSVSQGGAQSEVKVQNSEDYQHGLLLNIVLSVNINGKSTDDHNEMIFNLVSFYWAETDEQQAPLDQALHSS